jgi:hypothetical protein
MITILFSLILCNIWLIKRPIQSIRMSRIKIFQWKFYFHRMMCYRFVVCWNIWSWNHDYRFFDDVVLLQNEYNILLNTVNHIIHWFPINAPCTFTLDEIAFGIIYILFVWPYIIFFFFTEKVWQKETKEFWFFKFNNCHNLVLRKKLIHVAK